MNLGDQHISYQDNALRPALEMMRLSDVWLEKAVGLVEANTRINSLLAE